MRDLPCLKVCLDVSCREPRAEGLGLRAILSPPRYADLDFDHVVTEIGKAAGPDSYHGCWQGAEETGLYFFGTNAEEMFTRVEPVLRTLPIAQNARIVVGHGKESLQPRTVRMPRDRS